MSDCAFGNGGLASYMESKMLDHIEQNGRAKTMHNTTDALKEELLDLFMVWVVVWEKLWPAQVYVLTAVVWFFVGYLGLKAV